MFFSELLGEPPFLMPFRVLKRLRTIPYIHKPQPRLSWRQTKTVFCMGHCCLSLLVIYPILLFFPFSHSSLCPAHPCPEPMYKSRMYTVLLLLLRFYVQVSAIRGDFAHFPKDLYIISPRQGRSIAQARLVHTASSRRPLHSDPSPCRYPPPRTSTPQPHTHR